MEFIVKKQSDERAMTQTPIILPPQQFELVQLEERIDENGNPVKVQQSAGWVTIPALEQEKAYLLSKIAEIDNKIAQCNALLPKTEEK